MSKEPRTFLNMTFPPDPVLKNTGTGWNDICNEDSWPKERVFSHKGKTRKQTRRLK